MLGRYNSIAFPHKVSPLVREVMSHHAIVDVLQAPIGTNVRVRAVVPLSETSRPAGPVVAPRRMVHPQLATDRCAPHGSLVDDVTVVERLPLGNSGVALPGVLWPMRAHDNPEFGRHSGARESYGFPYPADDAVPLEVAVGRHSGLTSVARSRTCPGPTGRRGSTAGPSPITT